MSGKRGEWRTQGWLFANGWTIDDLNVARRFLSTRNMVMDVPGPTRTGGERRLVFFIEEGFTLEQLRELHAAEEFIRAAKNGDK